MEGCDILLNVFILNWWHVKGTYNVILLVAEYIPFRQSILSGLSLMILSRTKQTIYFAIKIFNEEVVK